jgi:hypothetical protein
MGRIFDDRQFDGHRLGEFGLGGFGLVQWQCENLAAHSQEQEEGGFENCHFC